MFDVANDTNPGSCLPYMDDLPGMFDETFKMAKTALDAVNALSNIDARVTLESATLFKLLWGIDILAFRKGEVLAEDEQEDLDEQ